MLSNKGGDLFLEYLPIILLSIIKGSQERQGLCHLPDNARF